MFAGIWDILLWVKNKIYQPNFCIFFFCFPGFYNLHSCLLSVCAAQDYHVGFKYRDVTRQILLWAESALYHPWVFFRSFFCVTTPCQAPCRGSQWGRQLDKLSLPLIGWQDASDTSCWVNPLSLFFTLLPGLNAPLVFGNRFFLLNNM